MEINSGQLLLWGVVGLAFQYLIIFLASRHANEKTEKKIDELRQEIERSKG